MMKKKTRLVSLIMTGAMALSLVGGTGVTAFAHDEMAEVTVNFPVPTVKEVVLTDVSNPGHTETIEYPVSFETYTVSSVDESVKASVPAGTYSVEVINHAPASYTYSCDNDQITLESDGNTGNVINITANPISTSGKNYEFSNDVYNSLCGKTYVWGSYHPELDMTSSLDWFPNSLFYLYIVTPSSYPVVPIMGGLKESTPTGGEVISDDTTVIGYADLNGPGRSLKNYATYMYLSQNVDIVVPVVPQSTITVENGESLLFGLLENPANYTVTVDEELLGGSEEEGEESYQYTGQENTYAVIHEVEGSSGSGGSMYRVEVSSPLHPDYEGEAGGTGTPDEETP